MCMYTDREIAFKLESKKHPNYGRVSQMKPAEWWANVRMVSSNVSTFST